MSDSIVTQIEDGFNQSPNNYGSLSVLSITCMKLLNNRSDLDQQLALMANDPEIQSELRNIEREFSHVEDALSDVN
ncbi:MAG TPA: hypothetical protein VGC91_19430 [Pyrinomonadaceae bacterium]